MQLPTPWLTNIPTHWKTAQLGHVAKISTGSADVQGSFEASGEYPFFVRSHKIRKLDYFTHDTEAVLRAGDGNVGEIFHHYSVKFIAHQRVYIIEPIPKLSGRFLFYVMKVFFKESLMGNTAKSTVESLRRPILTGFRIPLPPLNEQVCIADELDRKLEEIDEFIADQTRLQELLDEHRISFIDDVLNPYWESTIALKHLGTLSSGITLGAKYTEETETYPYLRVANVQAGKLDLSEIKEVSVPESVAKQNLLQTEGGDWDKLGRGALWNGEITPMLHQNHVFAFRCDPQKLLPEFLVYCLESSLVRSYFETTAKQSTNLATTNSTIVKNCKIPSIKIETQKLIIIEAKKFLNEEFNTSSEIKILEKSSTKRKESIIAQYI